MTTPIKPTWTPDLDHHKLGTVQMARAYRLDKPGSLEPAENAHAVIIGTLVIWMKHFRAEFAEKFDEDLTDNLHLGYDGDDFQISADGRAVDLLHWLEMPLHHLLQAHGYEWRADSAYYWTLVRTSR